MKFISVTHIMMSFAMVKYTTSVLQFRARDPTFGFTDVIASPGPTVGLVVSENRGSDFRTSRLRYGTLGLGLGLSLCLG